ncbi:MAG TPA: tetratricopeptide repeat-containing sensor histidine kinase, partial [Mucilaginibacter sp.]|nr:tetratricopeptide repeat-containing sensor histidine kinase [Mucilaginibacter sp.]
AIKNFDEAIAIYKKINNQYGLAACYVQYGRMYNLLANYDKALNYLNAAFPIIKKSGNELALTDCYKNIGAVYFSHGQLSKALDFYYKGLFIAVKNHYTIPTAELYNNIGVILQTMEVYPNALEYYKKAIIIFQGANNLQALGIMYENIGEVLVAQKNFDQAIDYLDKANSIAKKQNDQDGLSSVYTDLGLCYANKGDFKRAISYLDTSLLIGIKYRIVYNQAYSYIGYATVYNMQKDYKKAYTYAVKGQQLAIELGNLSVKANAALQLNKTLAGLGRVDEAYTLLNQYIDLKNSLKDNESIQKLTSYNFELSFAVKQRLQAQQQHEKDLLYKQNTRAQRLTILVFLVIIIAMIGITAIYYKQKKKQQQVNAMLEHKNAEVLEQKADLDQQTVKLNDLNTLKDRLIAILAHDLRAPLSTLRGLFDLLQDDTISHEEMLAMIPDVLKKLEYTSDFLDTLLFWINSQMETFDKAVKNFSVRDVIVGETENYHEQASRKGISLIENVPDELTAFADPSSVQIVVRNLITNAIKFSGKDDVIEVSAVQEEDNILIKIKDTGQGMTPEQSRKLFKSKVDSKTGTSNEQGTGMGLLFCKDLVEKCNGRIWVKSKQGMGSEFSFTVPKASEPGVEYQELVASA